MTSVTKVCENKSMIHPNVLHVSMDVLQAFPQYSLFLLYILHTISTALSFNNSKTGLQINVYIFLWFMLWILTCFYLMVYLGCISLHTADHARLRRLLYNRKLSLVSLPVGCCYDDTRPWSSPHWTYSSTNQRGFQFPLRCSLGKV